MELAKGISYSESLKTSYAALCYPEFLGADYDRLVGDHQSIFEISQKKNIVNYAKSSISLSMVTTSLHQSSISKT
jgi:hypothetical protein